GDERHGRVQPALRPHRLRHVGEISARRTTPAQDHQSRSLLRPGERRAVCQRSILNSRRQRLEVRGQLKQKLISPTSDLCSLTSTRYGQRTTPPHGGHYENLFGRDGARWC